MPIMTTFFFAVLLVLLVLALMTLAVVDDRQPITAQSPGKFSAIAFVVAAILALVTFLAII